MCKSELQEKSKLVWKYFLERVQRRLRESKDRAERKMLRQAVRDFKSLIAARAAVPGSGSYKVTKAGTVKESIPA